MAKPTMAELESGKIQPGGGDPPNQDLTEEQRKQQQAAAEEEAKKKVAAAGTPSAEELIAQEEEKKQARIAELKAKPEDELTAEEKAELQAAASPQEPPAETTIWEDVDALRGEPIEIDWSKHTDAAGNPVDPDTPEGIFIREKYIEQRAVQRFEESLMKEDPRGYAYILHRQAGGTDEDFFAKKTITLPEYDTFKESVDLQQKVLADDLRLKGVPEKQVKLLVDQAVKDKEIFELADQAYKAREAAQQKEIENIAAQLKKEQDEYERSVSALNKRLSDEITSNSSMNFLVPDAKKAEFAQFVRSNIQYADGKFFAVQELSDKALARILEGLYLQFSNGDISGLVKRTAQTQNVKKLQKKVQQSQQIPRSSGETPIGPKKIPISQI